MNEIRYPKKRSEVEIQALLWYFLRKKKIDARLEVLGHNPVTNRRSCRLDIVIFKEKKAICIIECKSWSRSYSQVREYRHNNSSQLTRYRNLFGLPVFLCGRIEDITRTQDNIIKLLGS